MRKHKKRSEGKGKYARNAVDGIPEPVKVWEPRTALGKAVKEGRITSIDEIFRQGLPIMEDMVVDSLVPGIQEDLLLIGQAKGKFGGGQRRIFRQTQKKTKEGNKIHFTTCALVGNRNGYMGIGLGKSKETVPSRDKAKREARINLMRIRRGCGSWQCNCKMPHSIPFAVKGKCSSVEITLMPAPKGKGLCIEKECAKILAMAGIKDIWSRTRGHTKTKLNLLMALLDALKSLNEMKVRPEELEKVGLLEGKIPVEEQVIPVEEPVREPVRGQFAGEQQPVGGNISGGSDQEKRIPEAETAETETLQETPLTEEAA